ncbi:MAG TPA: DUF4406 domain-containing protein [Candidatus Paceibacterota bacterium]|nr:DUF4406 domain-containing protein [Candidatus Paceibacterota bacterium]
MPISYLYPGERERIACVTTFEELGETAFLVLMRMVQPVCMVCGPISTGGRGSIEENLTQFEIAISMLAARGFHVFSQMPFERPMHRIKNTPYYRDGLQLLEAFYLPIFEARLVRHLYFLPDWKTSEGARWEHAQAIRIGMEIHYLTENDLR